MPDTGGWVILGIVATVSTDASSLHLEGSAPVATAARPMNRRSMAILALSHVCDDANQSFLPALLPFLIVAHGLSYTAAATLILAMNVSSSVVQPAIGILADRVAMPVLIAIGVFLAGAGIAMIGVVPDYWMMFAFALCSGLGVAIFHPEAARFANYVAGSKKVTGMRWFSAGGNAGFAIGPMFATGAIALFGLHGTLVAIVPVTVIAVFVVLELPRLHVARALVRKAAAAALPKHDNWPAFMRLGVFITIRSMAYIGLVGFVPLYFVGALHTSPTVGSLALTAMLTVGIAGTILGGPLADRYGRRRIILWSTACAAVMILATIAILDHVPSVPFAFAALIVVGFVITASQSAFLVVGQEYLPNHLGVASGVTIGLAVSLGGIFSPVLGAIADHYGVAAAILAIGVLTALAAASALTLPESNPAPSRA